MSNSTPTPSNSGSEQLLLSVCIATQNQPAHLLQVLRCLIRQITPKYAAQVEVIVCEHGSSELTPRMMQNVCAEYNFVRFIQTSYSSCQVESHEKSLAAARGRYIWLFRDDALLTEGALGHLLNLLSSDQPALVCLNYSVKSMQLNELLNERRSNIVRNIHFESAQDLCSKFGLLTFLGYTPTIIFEKRTELSNLLREYAGYDPQYFPAAALLEMFRNDKCLMHAEPLVVRRYEQQIKCTSGACRVDVLTLLSLLRCMKTRGVLSFRQVEDILEMPVESEACTLAQIIIDNLVEDIKLDLGVQLVTWQELIEMFSCFCNQYYLDRIFQVHEIYLEKLVIASRFQEALPHLQYLIVRRPDHPDAFGRLSQVLFKLGLYDQAASSAKRALKLEPAQRLACYTLVAILQGSGHYAEAIDHIQRLWREDRSEPDDLVGLAKLQLKAHRYDDALGALREFDQLQPNDERAQALEGQALLGLRKFEQAASILKQIVSRNPRNAEAKHFLSLALWFLGEKQSAVSVAQQACALAKPADAQVFADSLRRMQEALL